MEALFKTFAENVGLGAELVCILCILIGGVATILQAGRAILGRELSQQAVRRSVWRTFAVWIVLALEFALAADIVSTAIAPTWDDIGQLAAIAAIRTALNYFLERDMEAMDDGTDAEPSDVAQKTRRASPARPRTAGA